MFPAGLRPWNADGSVLLRLATCDNATKAELPGVIASGHEVHSIPRAGLAGAARFPRHRSCRRLPALPLSRGLDRPRAPPWPCRHRSRASHPGTAFFCSNRHSKLGCGLTFAVHWHDVIPYCSLRTCQLFELLEKCAAAASTHAAWQASRVIFSLRTACRWLSRWRDLTSHVRARLGLVATPPGKSDGHADPMTLRHLVAAFPHAECPIAAFQYDLQAAITGLAC